MVSSVVFMGSPAFALPALRALHASPSYDVCAVYTQPDRPAGRGQHEQHSPVKRLALELGIPVRQPSSLRAAAESEALAALRADVCVVAAFGQILPPAVFDAPRRGTLNIHASLLPRHRGAAPVPAAILAEDGETGVTIMVIDKGLDTGPTLASRSTAIGPDDTAGSLLDRLAPMGAELLLEVLPDWLGGRIAPKPQDAALATISPSLRKEDAAIDWRESACVIWRRVRAYNPWPGARSDLDGEVLKFHEAWPLDGGDAEPGTILPLDAGASEQLGTRVAGAGFAIATGDGLLVPLVVQKAGRRSVDAASFARGERGLIGRRFASPATEVRL